MTSSRVAAHATQADARRRALLELVERDAFMWTWVQEVSRERIDVRSLPDDAPQIARAVRALGYGVELMNPTLDTKPARCSPLRARRCASGQAHA